MHTSAQAQTVDGPAPVSPRQNRLLAALTPAELEPLLPHMTLIGLPLGSVLYDPVSEMDEVYFPVCGVVSLSHTLVDGHATELAIVGNDGCIGIAPLLGGGTTPAQATVQIEGFAYGITASVVVAEFRKCHGATGVLLRYAQSLITQIMQTAVCNRHHTVEQQLCRLLLLSLDRLSGTAVGMTQQLIGDMLGVRRSGITAAARDLQAAGVIECARGRITVADRAKLEARACECYAVVRKEADRLYALSRVRPGGGARSPVVGQCSVPDRVWPGGSL